MVLSFVLSIGLFYYISGEERIEIKKTVLVEITAPEGMTIIGGLEREVKVTLTASRNVLSLLGAQRIIASHKISDVNNAGQYSFSIREKDIKLPQGEISVTNIDPKSLTITYSSSIKNTPAATAEPITPATFDS